MASISVISCISWIVCDRLKSDPRAYTRNKNKPGEDSLLSSANTTKPDQIGQAFNSNANHTEFLSRLIYFGLLLVARPTRLQIHSASTLPADVTVSGLRCNGN
jgi:hypothetical protein